MIQFYNHYFSDSQYSVIMGKESDFLLFFFYFLLFLRLNNNTLFAYSKFSLCIHPLTSLIPVRTVILCVCVCVCMYVYKERERISVEEFVNVK